MELSGTGDGAPLGQQPAMPAELLRALVGPTEPLASAGPGPSSQPQRNTITLRSANLNFIQDLSKRKAAYNDLCNRICELALLLRAETGSDFLMYTSSPDLPDPAVVSSPALLPLRQAVAAHCRAAVAAAILPPSVAHCTGFQDLGIG